MKYTKENLIVRPYQKADPDLIVSVSPQEAGWKYIHFQSRRLAAGEQWTFPAGQYEIALILLAGTLRAESNRGVWPAIGKRNNVFQGLPEALYLPIQSNLTLTGLTDCEFALAWVEAGREHPARFIPQEDVTVEIRGGDNVTRQINGIIRPGFDCDRLVVVEVYTPGGNWSSYPPHKHDYHHTAPDGSLAEADLEEVYYYKIDRPQGYAFQWIYTGDTSPLQQKGEPIDAVLRLKNDDLVLVPEGYHPVVSAPGFTTYYLNVLAGSAQSLTAEDDPTYAWVKGSYKGKDPRLPIYPVDPKQIIS